MAKKRSTAAAADASADEPAPFGERISTARLAQVSVAAFVLTVGVGLWLSQFQPKPAPVVDLEIASSVDAQQIVIDWGSNDSINEARHAIEVDFLLIVCYAIGLAALCLLARRIFRSPAARAIGPVLARAVLFAGALDVIENVAMLLLIAYRKGYWATIAATAAWPKFAIIVVALLYLVFAAVKAVFYPLLAGPRASAAAVAKAGGQPPLFSEGETPSWRGREWDPKAGKIGISCSGGGVRSAAYNLGALQVMTEREITTKAKFLTAVSGGAYIAGALTIMSKGIADSGLVRNPFEPRSPEEEHFRNNSSYLAPGVGGKAWLVVRLLIGVLINFLFLWLLLSVVAKPLGWLLRTRWLHPEMKDSMLEIPMSMWAPIGVFGAAAVAVAVVAVVVRHNRDVWYFRHLKIAGGLLALCLFLLCVLAVIPAGIILLERVFGDRPSGEPVSFGGGLAALQGAGVLTVVGSALKSLVSKNKVTVALAMGGLVTPLVGAISFLTLTGNSVASGATDGEGGAFGFTSGDDWVWFLVMGLVLFYFYRYSDQTTWSMHPFYKRRLCTVFAQEPKPGGGAGPIDYDLLQPLSTYAAPPGWPELVVCAAANVSDPGESPPRRNSVSFVFSASEVGGPDIGWLKTTAFEAALGERRKEDITLPAAIAISGAAVSPGMGKMTYGQVSPLIALANARLGVWLPNPRWIAWAPGLPDWWNDRPRVIYLIKEILGRYSKDDPYLYVTDGGHWDNMGLVELLRRGCTKIYCFDAAGDHTDTFFTFGEALAIARSELGVEFDIKPALLKPDEGQRARNRVPRDVVRGNFVYPGGVRGKIVLAKAGVREDAPWDVQAYADKDKRFPTHGLLHQLFTDKNFEAYRKLGRFAAENAIKKMDEPGYVPD